MSKMQAEPFRLVLISQLASLCPQPAIIMATINENDSDLSAKTWEHNWRRHQGREKARKTTTNQSDVDTVSGEQVPFQLSQVTGVRGRANLEHVLRDITGNSIQIIMIRHVDVAFSSRVPRSLALN